MVFAMNIVSIFILTGLFNYLLFRFFMKLEHAATGNKLNF